MTVKKKVVLEKNLPEVSAKSTKDQILSAYNEVLEMLETQQVQSPLEEKKKSEETQVVAKSSQSTVDSIVSHLANLKISLTKQMDLLSEKLLEEFQKLSELKQAIAIEQKHLEDVYGIKETANSLSALLLAQKQETEKFDQKMEDVQFQFDREMEDKKALWTKKQTDLETNYNEMKDRLIKQHKRDEEEYAYTLEVSRKKESQLYAQKQETLEKELQDRNDTLAQKELLIESRLKEMEELQAKVGRFPEELAHETARVTQEVTERLKSQYQFESTLKDKEVEGENKLLLQTIKTLEEKVKEQEKFISQLTNKANEATHQVQAIACKALEASSQRFPVNDFSGGRQEKQG